MTRRTQLPEVLTLEEVAAYLRLPVDTVASQAAAGLLPGREIAGSWRFLKAALDEWLRGPQPAAEAPAARPAPAKPPRPPRKPRAPKAPPAPPDTRDLALPEVAPRALSIPFVGCAGPNFEKGRRNQPILAIVNHVMIGTLAGTESVFGDPNLKDPVSANYGISQKGEIVQFVRDEDTAFANGPIRNPNDQVATWLLQPFTGGVTPNHRSISIEWEGFHQGGTSGVRTWHNVRTGQDEKTAVDFLPGTLTGFWHPSEPQYQAGLALIRDLVARHQILTDRAHINRHSDVDSIKKWFCPGEGFPMQRLLDDLNGTTTNGTGSPLASTDFPLQGPPTISQAAFTLTLQTAHSPALDEADAATYYKICTDNGVDPNVALAFFAQETQYGTQDGAGDNKNWGNLWDHQANSIGVYDTWQQGLIALCHTFTSPPYTDAGPPTIASIVPIHRGTDRPDNATYLAALARLIKQAQGT